MTIQAILQAAEEINNDRTIDTIMVHMKGEVQELQEEIDKVNQNQEQGADGITGEAIDIILCAVDMIHRHNPNITEEEIAAIAAKKLEKWKKLYTNKTYDK